LPLTKLPYSLQLIFLLRLSPNGSAVGPGCSQPTFVKDFTFTLFAKLLPQY
jgi:hypothetical protein